LDKGAVCQNQTEPGNQCNILLGRVTGYFCIKDKVALPGKTFVPSWCIPCHWDESDRS
jgi:hypothetical protein